ncbi:MAG: glutamine--tRNA ligase/YqeY domain fusion protein [Alphaproteobacteria bacterium]|jgi:glutaminyl-tRNA synthetase|nr:glutamine--tRNA ligase/YqeY domain fusion protein [Alphaproteobacteria bacterium]MBT4086763.1 glutamine--tRNA ligase/YqeY domain fusion protein [Alphaproteobacteria bacterium]MBT4545069.1 glutamine--tRNA ligase/YqeY domain fusion protein [Alphaproteobacteria bacterium]MBT7746343.1 glutamine--tRNA ligase/YqeY domain fusion protein [Alphaproteobacteria bacterium]
MSEADKGSTESAVEAPRDFIREIIQSDLDAGRVDGLVTRFPPEPNGYLHIGHAKSLCLNFGVAEEFGGRCHLRFDDTNPVKEETLYIDAIKKDVSWLGFDWGDHLYFASDNFEQLYAWAVDLLENGKAYVDDLNAEEMREYRGTLTKPGRNSPHRDRSVEENLDLFARMRAGEFANGEKVVRAKIDMAAGNINLRDPAIYRILHETHPRTGDAWCIYPTYDFAHGQTDAIEGITHSLCTLEFEDHRPLYDWFVANLPVKTAPHQYEFSRLSLSHTVLSKRNLKQLVDDGKVSGWDDPRMPTLSGFRRRGYPASAIRTFARQLGFTKSGDSVVEMANLDFFVREALNKTALRRMAVLNPLKVTIENWPEGQVDWMDAVNNPEDEGAGKRKVPFTRELYIERDDFMEDAPKKFFRLSVGREVRFKYGFFVTCTEAIKDDKGEVIELKCTYDPETRSGTNPPDGRKVKGTIHWVSAVHAIKGDVRLYDPLFNRPDPGADGDFQDDINPDSLTINTAALLEPSLADASVGEAIQFERLGYFCADPDHSPNAPVFNRTIGLRDSWAKAQKKG